MQAHKFRIAEKYNKYAKWYNFFGFLNELAIGRYRKKMLKEVSGKILEIGIGTGATLTYYPKNCEITGIDISKEMLKYSKEKCDKLKLKCNLKIGDAEKLPFKNNSFDYVVDCLGLCTYSNPVRALKEMKRVLKKNGKLLLLEHGLANKGFHRWWQNKRNNAHIRKVGCSLTREHDKLVGRAGLKIITFKRKFSGIVYIIEAQK